MNLICDQNKELSRYAKALFDEYKAINPGMAKSLGAISHGSRLDFKVIQAADLLVHAHFCNQSQKTDDNWYMLQRLIRKENDFRWYGEEGLAITLEKYAPPQKLAVQSNPQAARRDAKRKERHGARAD